MKTIVNGIGIGFFSSFFLSLYIDTFIGIVIPIYITYFIIAPLISAVSIVLMLYSNKEKKSHSGLEWWEEEEPLRKRL